MSEYWPVSNEGVGMPPQPLEKENARLREAVKQADELLDRLAHWDVMQSTGDGEWWRGEITRCRAALGDQTEGAEDGD